MQAWAWRVEEEVRLESLHSFFLIEKKMRDRQTERMKESASQLFILRSPLCGLAATESRSRSKPFSVVNSHRRFEGSFESSSLTAAETLPTLESFVCVCRLVGGLGEGFKEVRAKTDCAEENGTHVSSTIYH